MVVRDHRDPIGGIVHRGIEQRFWPSHGAIHLDLGERRVLEPLHEDDVGVGQVALRERNGIGFRFGALEQDALSRPFHQHALDFSLVPMPPRILALLIHFDGVRSMLDRHHAELATHELRRERDEKRRLARVPEADDRDHARRCHSTSARSRSSGVFTLKKSSAGSPNARTWARERIPTLTSGWKEMAFKSPLSRRRAIAGPHAGPYTAQSGSKPRRPELSGRNAS